MSSSILVIDDDESIRTVVCEVLEDEGYTVQTAANGAEGIAIIAQEQPSLVLLDMRMPVLDGWQFAHALQTQGIHLPIVVMTAAQDAKQWGQEVDALDYLAKPFNLNDLLDTIARVMHNLHG